MFNTEKWPDKARLGFTLPHPSSVCFVCAWLSSACEAQRTCLPSSSALSGPKSPSLTCPVCTRAAVCTRVGTAMAHTVQGVAKVPGEGRRCLMRGSDTPPRGSIPIRIEIVQEKYNPGIPHIGKARVFAFPGLHRLFRSLLWRQNFMLLQRNSL